ncbi:PorP/SprF family type IX secretion system membrane protein [Polaribacter sp.]|uniref:PorP/SprF family type IX secretion system membrane protein n=1 Tax=Polaribacter sp. TaxID=1920175 RepID=UPI0040476DE0
MKNQGKIVSQKITQNRYFFGLILLFLSFNFWSQQVPHYTQYLYNMQIINPAYVGSRAELSASLLSREQWVGIEGAPKTRTFSINARLRRGLGIGTTFVNDNIGLSETNNVNIDVSYTLITSQYSRLSFGLKGGMTFFTNNLADGITPDNDIYETTSGNFPNVGFGAFFYNQKMYAGVSIPHLLETPQFYINDSFNQPRLSQNPSIFLTAGTLYDLTENIKLKPSTMIRYTKNLPLSVDVNLNLFYKNLFEAGISYRHQSTVSALFAVILNKKFRVGYAYDHKFDFAGGNFGTHEIILHVDINLLRNTHWLLSNECYF